ncbi:MAG: c-type cytochrome domain-containing protein, partial [Pirellulaceae bacterium]
MTTLLPLLRRIVRGRWFLITLGVHLVGLSRPVWQVSARAEDAPPATQATPGVSYFRDVLPIFQAQCHGCHQPAKREGQYVMTDVASLRRGGESGEPAVVPGNPAASALWNQIRADQGTPAMPKGRPPLAAPYLKQIEAWIAAGAVDDSPPATRSRFDADHPPQYAAPPVITALDYSPDGQWLAISGYHEVLLYRPEQGLEGRLIGLSERIESAVFSPDGRQLAVTGGSPGRLGEIQLWRVEQRELAWSQTVGFDTLYGASWSRDGKRVAFGCPDKT